MQRRISFTVCFRSRTARALAARSLRLHAGVDLTGKVVVITGASAGVGRAVAREFAAKGARLGLLARGVERLEAAREEAIRAGTQAIALPADVADAAAVDAAATRVEQELGPIDIWVNNAMTTVFGPVDSITPEEFRRITEVTYLGTVYGTMSALRRMRPRNRGVIVQVGSALAYRGIPLQAGYCGAKHGARGFTDSVRTELLHDGCPIRLTMVHLPAVNTPQFDWCRSRMPRRAQPVPPIFEPEVAARAVVWASQHGKRELYVGWPTLKTIVGNKLLPGLADHLAADQGWDGQMTSEAEPESRPGNLFEPVPGDYEAHGRFGTIAKPHSIELWAGTHRPHLLLGALGLGALTTVLLAARRK